MYNKQIYSDEIHMLLDFLLYKKGTSKPKIFGKSKSSKTRTTDAQRAHSLHCTAENSIPIPKFMVWRQHILSATSAQFFRWFWFMPSLDVRSPWCKPRLGLYSGIYGHNNETLILQNFAFNMQFKLLNLVNHFINFQTDSSIRANS